ncbi:MAG: cytidine deaminase, partial [Lachnospiraceae bacterium]|nr:cytidine deaminase [Lachnospiraceae bacterium]
FSRIAIVGNYPGREGDYCAPCGVCRQVMAEFCNPETFQVILARSPEEYRVYLLKDLLPVNFGPSNLIG